MTTNNSQFSLKNIGFDQDFFSKLNNELYIIKKSAVRKIFSEGAITKISEDLGTEEKRKFAEAEDLEMYGVDNEFSLDEEENGYGGNFISKETNFYEENEQQEQPNMAENNLSVFKNCSQSQMNRLNAIIDNINSTTRQKLAVKAYKSKLKTKFYQVYEKNSEWLKEKNKYKLFHKCNYPRCNRTFASSGWLKAHFSSHIDEIKKDKFNILFEEIILKFKGMEETKSY